MWTDNGSLRLIEAEAKNGKLLIYLLRTEIGPSMVLETRLRREARHDEKNEWLREKMRELSVMA